MFYLVTVIFFAIFFFQIGILNFEVKNKTRTLWGIYFSTIAAVLASLLVVYAYWLYYLNMTLSTAVQLWMLFCIIGLTNIVLTILGVISKIKQTKSFKIENKDIPKSKLKFVKVILTFICIWIIIFGSMSIYMICFPDIEKDLKEYVEQYTLNCMNSKYGDCNFKVTNITKDYTGGFFGTTEEWDGFIVYVKSKSVPKTMTVFLDGITKDNLKFSYDSLISDYYELDYFEYNDFIKVLNKQKEKKINKDFAENFNLFINISDFDSYIIPKNYGHIPTKEELVDLVDVNVEYIDITILDRINKDEELNYLKKLAKALIKYFDIKEDVHISYLWSYTKGYIKIENDIVTIKLNNIENIFSKDDILN